MKIKLLPAEERPVEKIVGCGVGSLSNAELIAVLLGSGNTEESAIGLAEQILSCDEKGIHFLSELSLEDLKQFAGVGDTKAARILAAVELGKRIKSLPSREKIGITTSEDVVELLGQELRYAKKENFMVLLLNAKGELISKEVVSIGELTSTVVHPREAFSHAVRRSAAAVIFVHNHPSGDPSPSEEDVDTTRLLVECGRLLKIKVLDHIIIGDGLYTSMKTLGYMDERVAGSNGFKQ